MAAAWPAIAAAASKDRAQLSPAERDALKLYYLMHRDAGYQALVAAFTRASVEHREIELRSNTAMVLEERSDSKPAAHLLFRGMYDQPRELLEAATPSFLPPMAPGLARNRLGLARWMVDRANPLFSRVTVNRFWQEFLAPEFSNRPTTSARRQPPSHPELLDWLAVEFRESGWDVKSDHPMSRPPRTVNPRRYLRTNFRAIRKTSCWRADRGSASTGKSCAMPRWQPVVCS